MKNIRHPEVAGSFYPADERELRMMVSNFFRRAQSPNIIPKAMIVPHAGYVYSGDVAASAYACVKPVREKISKVVMIGPAHGYPRRGIFAHSAEAFDTPLGSVPVDQEAISRIESMPQVNMADEAHRGEHSLEVHLPFLCVLLGSFKLVPLLVGHASAQEVGEVLEELWGGDETLIVISSDLSHYHKYSEAKRIDASTANAIEELRYEDIAPELACGCHAINGLLWIARRKKLKANVVDLRNSGDVFGDHGRVVGYGAFVFEEAGL